jgi:ABC-type branched-subunit amino acid transport system permease subunit
MSLAGASRNTLKRQFRRLVEHGYLASQAAAGVPLLASLLHPDRWLLWLGILFILCVYYFPAGIVGRLRR